MHRFITFITSLLICCPAFAGIATDHRLAELEAAYSDTDKQLDLNVKSGAIRQYLDERLAEIESEIDARFAERDQNGLKTDFQQSCVLWRQYRTQFVDVWGQTYEGGSIRPFIENGAWSDITKARIVELEAFLEELTR